MGIFVDVGPLQCFISTHVRSPASRQTTEPADLRMPRPARPARFQLRPERESAVLRELGRYGAVLVDASRRTSLTSSPPAAHDPEGYQDPAEDCRHEGGRDRDCAWLLTLPLTRSYMWKLPVAHGARADHARPSRSLRLGRSRRTTSVRSASQRLSRTVPSNCPRRSSRSRLPPKKSCCTTTSSSQNRGLAVRSLAFSSFRLARYPAHHAVLSHSFPLQKEPR